MLPPKCPHMRSLEENHTVEINLLSSQQENLKSRSHSIEQNSQPNWDETNERNGQNSSNFHNNAPRKTGRRLTDVNIQEENSEHLHKPKFSSTSATDRPLVCSRMSSRSSSSSKSQTQSLKQQSGF
uniref:Uncharacterized protein n=1 Tax=Acrobeloides nanus TaxID=290746 RepID=A0A914DF06_9BILA